MTPIPGMNVGLGALDVVVQVVSEQVDQIDGVVPGVFVRVTWEEDKGDVAHTVANSSVSSFEPSRGISTEENLGGCGTGSPTFFKLLNINTVGI